jgi:protein TonB
MGHYSTAETPDRLKAILAVAGVHVALGAVILTGLDVNIVSKAVERLQTFDIAIPEPPPPPPPPPPQQRSSRAKEDEGAAGKKADPTPVVAPKPKIEVPAKSPIVAAPVPGTGSAASAGAAASGTGTGAGGSGSGRGGGGSGDFSGFTPAFLVRNLNRGDYRPLAAGRLPRGSASVSLTVDTSGAPTNCRVVRSSGDSAVDGGLCPLVTRRLRFRPARDASGKPVPYSLTYTANWTL